MPVVVLTTSNDEKEIASLYELGATSFITKPPSFAAFIEVARAIRRLIESP
jgi:DNA-binding response OmpR family regulator